MAADPSWRSPLIALPIHLIWGGLYQEEKPMEVKRLLEAKLGIHYFTIQQEKDARVKSKR